MHRQSIVIKAPKSFMEQVLWPEFQKLLEEEKTCDQKLTKLAEGTINVRAA